jgi:drug/metabolite transporter (DMT)-like permease
MKNQTAGSNSEGELEITHEPSLAHSQVHLKSVVIALFVTVLWASSFVVIKFGLEEVPALTFAALRYSIASVVLLFIAFTNNRNREILRQQSKKWWIWIVGYGLIYIAVTQGTQFVALNLMPATTVSLMLNLTPILVLLFSAVTLNEHVTKKQILYVSLVFVGLFAYFYPVDLKIGELIGFIVIILSLLANAASTLLGRAINRTKSAPSLIVTSISMSIGAAILLGLSLATEEQVLLSSTSIFYIIWLALLNTALAFTLWNRAMRTLRAIDTSLINSMMLPQIVFLSIIFLGEIPTLVDWIGIAFVTIGVLLVQVDQAKRSSLNNKKANQ